MTNRTVYTRVYSKSSAGELVASKAPEIGTLSHAALLGEFRNHAKKWNEVPTALVSVSHRIVDTLKRAFDKHEEEGESPAGIWIIFIKVPLKADKNATCIHSAKTLAAKCGISLPEKHTHESVFEWRIPQDYVSHRVSLETLMKRGLKTRHLLEPSTKLVRISFARDFKNQGPWDLGLYLGFFAQMFGARAPSQWISKRLFQDCVRDRIMDDDLVELQYAHEHGRYAHEHVQYVDFDYFEALYDGISTALYEQWLSELDFFHDLEEFEEQRDLIEDALASEEEDFCELWADSGCDGRSNAANSNFLYEEARRRLSASHYKQRAAIEAEAVKIGL